MAPIIRAYFAIVAFALISINAIGQIQSNPNIMEAVRMHLNSAFLVTGETLLFSADLVSVQTNKYSDLSSILYVEIINDKYEPIYQAKIRVNEGKGNGDFFIPSLIPTGSYQLIAYTRWMKNFNQYYHHPLQIINPFEVYKPIPKNEKLNVSFYPEGGNLVQGVENRVVVELTNYAGEGISFNGRIVDQAGSVLTSIQSEIPGYGVFKYTPESNSDFQLIVEDLNDNFQFFDLAKPQMKQHTIQVDEFDRYFLVKVACDCEDRVQLQVYHGQQRIYINEIESNSEVRFSKMELKQGTLLFTASQGGEVLSKRLIYNRPIQNNSVEDLGSYDKRSLISFPIDLKDAARLSISVNKIYDHGLTLHRPTTEKYLTGVNGLYKFNDELLFDPKANKIVDILMITSNWKFEEPPKEISLLPDHRGEIVSGGIQISDTMNLGKKMVAYSIIGTDYQVKMAPIDKNGKFQMVVEPLEEDRVAYITSLDDLPADFIEIDYQFLEIYPKLEFPQLMLDSVMVKEIVDRSIRNQIENAYYEVSTDSIIEPLPYIEYFSGFDYFYVLDDYNRFPTLRESFVEYIPMVAVRGKGSSVEFKVLLNLSVIKPHLEPYAFLDGLPVKSEEILKLSPYRIESIGVINNRYFLGPVIADGIISFRTKQGDLQGFVPGPQSRKLSYKGLAPQKRYNFPTYKSSELNESDLSARIPDYRDQLYWNPDVRINSSGAYKVEFFTSDTAGKFELVVDGVSDTGESISITKKFIVE